MTIENKDIIENSNLIYKAIKNTGVRGQDFIDDVYSDTVVRLKEYDTYDSTRGKLSVYLYLIAQSVARNALDKRRRSQDALHKANVSLSAIGGHRRTETDTEQRIKDMIVDVHLPAVYKQVLSYKHIHGMSFREIGNKLSTTEGAARVYYHRIKKELIKAYEQEQFD